jgi:hypothetical protein
MLRFGAPSPLGYRHGFRDVIRIVTLSVLTALERKSHCFSPSKAQRSLYYHQFNVQKFYVLPTQCIYVFCVDLRKKTAIISLYNIN